MAPAGSPRVICHKVRMRLESDGPTVRAEEDMKRRRHTSLHRLWADHPGGHYRLPNHATGVGRAVQVMPPDRTRRR